MSCAKCYSILISLVVFLVSINVPLSSSDAALEPPITLASPNGGENWMGGETRKVIFSTASTGGVVGIYYSTDGGLSFPNYIGEKANTGGSQLFAWEIPNNINSSKLLVRVELRSSDPSSTVLGEDISDDFFTILPGVWLEFAELPSVMSSAQYYSIHWYLYDGIGKVESLSLMARYRQGSIWGDWTEVGIAYSNIDPSQGGCWFTPRYFEHAFGQLKINAWTEPGGVLLAYAESSEFEIRSPWIQLISPNGGEALIAGEIYDIRWATSEDSMGVLTAISIEFSTNGGSTWHILVASTENDFVYEWNVPMLPSGVTSYDHVKIKVIALYMEFTHLANDTSDDDFRIVANSDVPSVGLISPNPYVPGAIVYRGGETHEVLWTATCYYGGIGKFRILLSIDNGSTWNKIDDLTPGARSYLWTSPSVDTFEAKIKIEMILIDTSIEFSQSANPFYIFTTTVWNRPPEAVAPDSIAVNEGDMVVLDGSHSNDPDGDALEYLWEQIDTTPFRVVLSDPTAYSPTFTPNVLDYEVILIFRLTVSDGKEILVDHYSGNIKCTSVRVAPLAPSITSFSPSGAWEGMQVSISGSNLMGGAVRIGGVLTATVPTAPTSLNPDPDHKFNFTLVTGIPTIPSRITVTTRAGTAVSEKEFDVYPKPWYCLDYGFNMSNTNKYFLSYPWLVWENGDYRRTFGNDVYINLWICLGLPYWTPWDGWDCWGYLVEEPICPDPFAALYYGAAYCYLARHGECVGFSAVSLELYHDLIETSEMQPGVYNIDDFVLSGALRERIDCMHGVQVSAESLHYIISQHLDNLAPSIYGFSGLGLVLYSINVAVDSGDLGIILLSEGASGHAVVPYEVVDVDSTHTRIYVYDINKPEWSTLRNARNQLNSSDERMNHPPYIEVDRSGLYWEWSYYIGPEEGWWGGPMGMVFLPSSIVLGDRTLPTTLDGVFNLIYGSASGYVTDEDGNEVSVRDDGTWVVEIENATPFVLYEDLVGSQYNSYYLPLGNYTTHIIGKGGGTYNWTMFSDARAAYAVKNAQVEEGSSDVIQLVHENNNPFMGIIKYETSDNFKKYSATQVKRFQHEERVYKILNATIFSDSEAVINVTADYNCLVFRNNGPHSFVFDVEFQTNVLCHLIWDEINGTLDALPSCRKSGIKIGPYETLIIYPNNWTNLMNAEIIIEGGAEDTDHIPLITGVIIIIATVAIVFIIIQKRGKQNKK